MMNYGYLILFGAIALVSYLVQLNLKHKIKKYSKETLPSGMRGCDVAARMLAQNGLSDVKITQIDGMLTDHYNPTNRTVNLSRDVYYGNNVAAVSVAAHECGHAIQHATAYSFLRMRSNLVPIVNIASKFMPWLLLIGILTIETMPFLMLGGIILFACTTLFSFVTLPVEIDASRRAIAWLNGAGITDITTHDDAKDALRAAAYTYVVAALSSLATLIYYIIIFMGRRD